MFDEIPTPTPPDAARPADDGTVIRGEPPLFGTLPDQVFDGVNPPAEQVEAAREVSEEHAAALAANAQLALTPPQFTPPFEGMVVTSLLTKNTYTIGHLIGEGSFGTVYAATDVWKNDLAIKVLKPSGTYEAIGQAAAQ